LKDTFLMGKLTLLPHSLGRVGKGDGRAMLNVMLDVSFEIVKRRENPPFNVNTIWQDHEDGFPELSKTLTKHHEPLAFISRSLPEIVSLRHFLLSFTVPRKVGIMGI
jgi:hypothetical protein